VLLNLGLPDVGLAGEALRRSALLNLGLDNMLLNLRRLDILRAVESGGRTLPGVPIV
jgi:hypothetical protein